jgi:hypothetical protein
MIPAGQRSGRTVGFCGVKAILANKIPNAIPIFAFSGARLLQYVSGMCAVAVDQLLARILVSSATAGGSGQKAANTAPAKSVQLSGVQSQA